MNSICDLILTGHDYYSILKWDSDIIHKLGQRAEERKHIGSGQPYVKKKTQAHQRHIERTKKTLGLK